VTKETPEHNPLYVMAAGGFLGGLLAGGTNSSTLAFFVLALGGSIFLLALLGHLKRDSADWQIGTVLGLSTIIPLPTGFVGMMIGRALWGGG
jgi:low affinity Fe/Cu permease